MKWNLNYIQKNAKPSFTFNEEITLSGAISLKLGERYLQGDLLYNTNACQVTYGTNINEITTINRFTIRGDNYGEERCQ